MTARNRKTSGRTAFISVVGAIAATDAARQSVADADAALVTAWQTDGEAAGAYVLGFYGEDLPKPGRTPSDDPSAGALAALLADLGISGPEADGYDAAKKRIQRVRWAALLRLTTGAPWAECGKAARDFTHARTLCQRGTAAVVTDDKSGAATLPTVKRGTSGPAVTDTTPVAGGPASPTATDLAVDAVAAATWRTTADTLHGIADRVRRGKPIDAAILAAMLADARAIVDALAPVEEPVF